MTQLVQKWAKRLLSCLKVLCILKSQLFCYKEEPSKNFFFFCCWWWCFLQAYSHTLALALPCFFDTGKDSWKTGWGEPLKSLKITYLLFFSHLQMWPSLAFYCQCLKVWLSKFRHAVAYCGLPVSHASAPDLSHFQGIFTCLNSSPWLITSLSLTLESQEASWFWGTVTTTSGAVATNQSRLTFPSVPWPSLRTY